jgi:hypothetical protein
MLCTSLSHFLDAKCDWSLDIVWTLRWALPCLTTVPLDLSFQAQTLHCLTLKLKQKIVLYGALHKEELASRLACRYRSWLIFEGLSARSSAFLIFHGLPQTLIPLLRHEAGSISSLINNRTVLRHVTESVVKYTTESNSEEVEHNVTYSLVLNFFIRINKIGNVRVT